MTDRPVLLFGFRGQIGDELYRLLSERGTVLAPGREEVNLSLADSVRTYIRLARPSIILNAAAYTDVDKAEEMPTLAMAVNTDAPRVMAEEAYQLGIALVHYSTDYVFDGSGGSGEPASPSGPGPYREGDAAKPLGVYGQSKWVGEEAIRTVAPAHLILRTSWVYSRRRRNFLTTIRRLALEQDELRIVDDQIGVPTCAHDIAVETVRILDRTNAAGVPAMLKKFGGTFNLGAAGATSWHGFATAIVDRLCRRPDWPEGRAKPAVTAIKTKDFETTAARPTYSVLDTQAIWKAFETEMDDWTAQLDRCLAAGEF
jgi:dTDP-4-dehydrorhamnose reductase